MRLPLLTFLCGPHGVGKTALAHILSDRIPACYEMSLYAPVRGAIIGGFFECDPSLELTRVPEQRLPGLDCSVRQFHLLYEDFLRQHFGKTVLAKLAAAHIKGLADTYEHFVIDDCFWPELEDLKHLKSVFGAQNCLIINIARGETEFDPSQLIQSNDVPMFSILNNATTPAELFDLVAVPLNLETLPRADDDAAALT